jgi:hypothetical protein
MFANTSAIPSFGNKGITAILTLNYSWVFIGLSYAFAIVKKISVSRETMEKHPSMVLIALKIKEI